MRLDQRAPRVRIDWGYVVPAICWTLALVDLIGSCKQGLPAEPAWVETVAKDASFGAEE